MSVLQVYVAATHVSVRADVDAPQVRRELPVDGSRPGRQELAPDAAWQATRSALREVLASAATPDAVRLAGEPSSLVVWDQETSGCPLPAIGPADRRTDELAATLAATALGRRVREVTGRSVHPETGAVRLARLREQEPNTWALVEAGRYVVGPLASYLVSRMTRGVWHLVDRPAAEATALLDPRSGTWSEELCAGFGVPVLALPDVVGTASPARTDPTVCAGLDVPLLVG